MGRLEDIVERNQNPRKHRRAMIPISLGLSIFVLLIIVLMVFTDLDESPGAQTPAGQPTSDPARRRSPASLHSGPEPGRVRGIGLYVERHDARTAD